MACHPARVQERSIGNDQWRTLQVQFLRHHFAPLCIRHDYELCGTGKSSLKELNQTSSQRKPAASFGEIVTVIDQRAPVANCKQPSWQKAMHVVTNHYRCIPISPAKRLADKG
jgi:hypothetical protein